MTGDNTIGSQAGRRKEDSLGTCSYFDPSHLPQTGDFSIFPTDHLAAMVAQSHGCLMPFWRNVYRAFPSGAHVYSKEQSECSWDKSYALRKSWEKSNYSAIAKAEQGDVHPLKDRDECSTSIYQASTGSGFWSKHWQRGGEWTRTFQVGSEYQEYESRGGRRCLAFHLSTKQTVLVAGKEHLRPQKCIWIRQMSYGLSRDLLLA